MRSKASELLAAFCICFATQDILIAQPLVSSVDYRFQHFDSKNGLPVKMVYAIVQDSLGFLWMHHPLELSRYDGYNFKVYKYNQQDSKSPGKLLDGSLMVDRSGNIWTRNNNGTEINHKLILSKYDWRTDGFIKFYPDLDGAIVSTVCFEENRPVIWFGTFFPGRGIYSFNYETNESINYLNNHGDSAADFTRGSSMEQKNEILDISDRGSFLLLATWSGLWKFDKQTKTFSRPKCNPKDSTFFYNYPILNIFEKPEYGDNSLWLNVNRGLTKVDENLQVLQRVDFPPAFPGYTKEGNFEVQNLTVDFDKEGILWICNHSGLYRYDPSDGSLHNIKHIPEDNYSLRTNTVFDVTVDRDQNIWVSTRDKGISVLKPPTIPFFNFKVSLGQHGIDVFTENGLDYIVTATSESGRIGDNQISIASVNPAHLDSLNFQRVKLKESIDGRINYLWKGKKNLWLGTWDHGIVGLDVNPATGIVGSDLKIFRHDPQNTHTIGTNISRGIWEDTEENLWVSTIGSGINKIVPHIPYGHKGSVVRYAHSEKDTTSIGSNTIWWEFYPEGEKSFWVITTTGIDLFRNERFEHVFRNEFATTIHNTARGDLLIGATDGLYHVTKNGSQYNIKKDPLNHKVISYQDDSLDRLWIINSQNLLCYDRNENIVLEFNGSDGIDHAYSAFFKTSSGILISQDNNGMTVFDPLSLKVNRNRTYPVLTKLAINNRTPPIRTNPDDEDDFAVKSDISLLDELVLNHLHNNFSIEFSAMEMTSPERNLYKHKLDGYDADWIETDWKNRTATYTNLDAGNYVFKVKASNHHGVWSDNETNLMVRILPPPWKTWWAYTLYIIAAAGIFLYWRSYENKRVELKHRAQHLSELDTLKTRFFTNISHEFRTPITLILGPLKTIYNKTTDPDQKITFGVMIRNTQRILRLINQLLDLSRLEAAKMHLYTSAVDLVKFLREITSSYESMAADRKIKYFFYPEVRELIVYIDQEKIEKVIHNVLSNAFKFTTQGGEIVLNLKVVDKHCSIVITDTGIGIPRDQLDKVFDRFYQVDNSPTRGYEGSGLGMALAKELVELHYGKITVESKAGMGTTFTVLLPLGNEHLREEEIVDLQPPTLEEYSEIKIPEGLTLNVNNQTSSVVSDQHPLLLIVEDNADMRNYIRKVLSEQYQIIEAENGVKGIKMAVEIIPDLIISDIMMPEMDGYQLCKKIKEQDLTSHIPVILLTAKADRESKLSGLEIGADDYLCKPFDAEELKLVVRNLTEGRRKLRERFSREITLEPQQIAITSLDEKFLTRTLAIIEAHMDDEHFSIEDFSSEAGYSNIHFYRKIKALSGQTPSRFLRTVRLKRAAELLTKKSDNISQIAYSVGFDSVSYFNKCFKEQFGMTPGQFATERLKTKV